MKVREFMTANLITISSDEPVSKAARMIYAHKVRRLPVVDDGRLVGIIGDRMVAASLPSAATLLSHGEMSDTLSKLIVKKVMHKDVITVTPDTTAESALDLAQANRIGCLVVVDDNRHPVGIVSTNDFIYRILNPLLGLKKPGTRLHIYDCGKPEQIEKVTGLIGKHHLELEVIHVDDSSERDGRDLIVQVLTKEPKPLIDDLTKLGYQVEIRKRRSWPLPDEA